MKNNVIKTGKVKVTKPFVTDYFDDDDGNVEINVKPGTYEFRVLDINGWKPRQLKIDGEWVDVMDQCKALEDILMAENKNLENEETTVANIAPTVDYIGHVKPVVFPGLDDNDTPDIYDDPEGEKRKDAEDAAGDDVWISPLGKLVAGESVRKVVGGMVGLND